MPTTRLSTKGQVILPKSIRSARAWLPGTEFSVEEAADGVLLRPAPLFPPTELDDVAGCLRYQGKAKSLAQMDEAIAKSVKRRYDGHRY